MADKLSDNEEKRFNPQQELKSFNATFSLLRKDIAKRVEEMRKSVGKGIIDTKAIKQDFDKMSKLIEEDAWKFGNKFQKVFEMIARNFKKSIDDNIFNIKKSAVGASLLNFKNEILKLTDEIKSDIGSVDFNQEALDDTSEKLDAIIAKSDTLIENARKEGLLKTRALKSARDMNLEMKNIVEQSKAALQEFIPYNNQLIAARESMDDLVDSAFGFIEKIPGGKYFSKALGLDTIKKDISDNVGKVLAGNLSKGVDTAGALKVALGGIVSTYLRFAKMLLLNPWTLLIVGTILLIKKMVDLQNLAEDFRHSTGLTLDQTEGMRFQIENAALAARKFGVSIEDVYTTTGELYNALRNIKLVTPSLAADLSILKENIGSSGEELSEVVGIFTTMRGVNEDNLKSWMGITTQLAEVSGVAPVDVFKDIAQNSELIGKYFRGNTKEVIKTAVEARKLGLSLSNIDKILDSIMDWETSINKELEASVLLGRNINFNQARYLAFTGDVSGAIDNIVNQMGTLESINALDPIRAKALAESIGLGVGEFKEMLRTKGMINELIRKGIIANKEEADQILNANELTAEQWYNQKRIHSQITQMKDEFIAIGAALGRVILPIFKAIMPAVSLIANVLDVIVTSINKLLDSINEILPGSKNIGKQLAAWPLLLLVAKKPLMSFVGMFKSFGLGGKTVGAGTTAIGGAGKGMGTFFESFKKFDMKSIGKFALISAVLIGTLIALAFALKQFDGVEWENLAMAGVALSGLALIGLVISKFPVGQMLLGAVAIALLGASLIPLAFAMSLMENVTWKTLGIAGAALIGFSLAAFALGTIMFTGVGALLFGAGILAIIALGGAMMVLGVATKMLADSFDSNSFIDDFTKLAEIGPKLALTTAAIFGLAGAITAFSVASAAASLLNTLSLGSIGIPEEININSGTQNIDETINAGNEEIKKKLDEVVKAVKDINLYIDGRKVSDNIARTTPVTKLT